MTNAVGDAIILTVHIVRDQSIKYRLIDDYKRKSDYGYKAKN